ncbi:group 1 glycosyl transferase [Caballeronia catudaia]|uniref:Group 1 glycosyl transferase n=2 Tax=Caballeronia catudaia TaxID=1777136 RepID=A0A158CA65_9BURK|nr:group 1 glycosyl transferase [Caballeronia catudaia]
MERVVWDLAQAFCARGIRTTVVTSAIAGRTGRFQIDGIDVVAIEEARDGQYSKAFWKGTLNAFDMLCEEGLDAVIGVSAGAREIVLHRTNRTVPVLMQAHGSSIGEFVSKWRRPTARSILGSARNLVWIFKDRHVLSRYDAIVAISDLVKRQIRWTSFLSRSHAPVEIIANGIDERLFAFEPPARRKARQAYGFDDTHQVIASVSRLHRQKGVCELILAFDIFARSNPGARLLIVGDGPDRNTLEALVRDKGLASRVVFTGALARSEVARSFAAADVFSFLTLRVEGLPLNMLEALAAGLPSVLARSVAASIPPQAGIFTVDPRDQEAVIAAFAHACEFAARGGRTQLSDAYRLEQCASTYLELIRRTGRR